MAFEIIDIINEADEVVGQVERTPAWDKTRPDPYRLVNILVRRRDGCFLVQQRALKKHSNPLRFGASVGGLVAHGESYLVAAHREMKEELNLEIPLRELGKLDFRRDGRLVSYCMFYEAICDGPFSGWEEESERLEFMTLDELKFMTVRFPYLFTHGLVEGIARFY